MTYLDDSPDELAGRPQVLPSASTAADAIEALTRSQLQHVLDAHDRKLKVYESLRASTTS
ncbi:hypothetical protein [Bradyrhizobium sp. UFLA01-814]|uniref:hypothetical protein n=1 Tax=Bradyrhizobium sp. UFLA01-814 TaxID=3023480 RepID=UPI00398B7E84